MAFRRPKGASANAKRFAEFRDANRDLLFRAGFPLEILESRHHFDLWLMHGQLYDVAPYFDSDGLSVDQRAALRDVLVNYLRAGFGDPGIMVFGSDELRGIFEDAGVPWPR